MRTLAITSAKWGVIAVATLAGACQWEEARQASSGAADSTAAQQSLLDPSRSGLDHIIVVAMENRSFDHFLGWLPNADGRQAGLTYPDRTGTRQATYPLAPDFQGCSHPDPDHSAAGGLVELDKGACDGWLLAGSNDRFAIGYYTEADLPFLGPAARTWMTFDRYFAPILDASRPNRMYLHAGATDRIGDALFPLATLPTIWDRLAEAKISGKYYFSDVPFTAEWGTKYLSITRPYAEFLVDCATGNLPAVSYVDPRFIDEASGTSGDDAPHSDIRAGETFLNLTYEAVTHSPAWGRTALIITFDEWGGFFDHVPPPAAPDVVPFPVQRGFRVPTVLISPFAKRGFVSHNVYDHASILKLIEWRFGLKPLAVRDEQSLNLALELDFSHPDPRAPHFSVPTVLAGSPCPGASLLNFSGLGSLP